MAVPEPPCASLPDFRFLHHAILERVQVLQHRAPIRWLLRVAHGLFEIALRLFRIDARTEFTELVCHVLRLSA